jgi:arylsulfatase A-like enzyme
MAGGILNRRWPWIAAAVLAIAVFLASVMDLRVGDPRPTGGADEIRALRERDDLNLLFVLVDTLRAERVGSYGYARDTSPDFDLLASRGVRFARHLAQSSWTKTSMASLWTATNPVQTGVTRFDHALSAEARMPAEILRDAGFLTAGLYRNGWVAPTFGFDQGFEVYDRPVGRPLAPSVVVKNPTIKGGGSDQDAIDAAIEFLRVNGRERWFLYLHLMDVHEYLYDEESALFGSSYSDVYDNSIRRVDGLLGQFLVYLAQNAYLENTLIAIVSDHGEAFRERGIEGHARKVYRESTEVPFALSFPFRLDPGVVIESRTGNVDVWPTLLDLLGLPIPEGVDGRSRVPEILAAARGDPQPDTDQGIAFLDQHWGQEKAPRPTVAVVEGTLRYVMSDEGDGSLREELFDASLDPRELRDVLAERPEDAERLRRAARAQLEAGPAPWARETKTLQLDELELNHLRALGYELP